MTMNDNLTGETLVDLRYRCQDCGKYVSLQLSVPSWLADSVRAGFAPRKCDSCIDRQRDEARRLDQNAARLECVRRTGIPENRREWRRELGNAELMEFVWANRQKSLFIRDDYGAGKTWALAATAWKLIERNPELHLEFWNFNDLSTRYAALARENIGDAETFKKRLVGLDLLIVDDLGKRKLNATAGDLLYAAVDGIYLAERRIWISANLSGDELLQKFEDRDIGMAVMRRIDRMRQDGRLQLWKTNNQSG